MSSWKPGTGPSVDNALDLATRPEPASRRCRSADGARTTRSKTDVPKQPLVPGDLLGFYFWRCVQSLWRKRAWLLAGFCLGAVLSGLLVLALTPRVSTAKLARNGLSGLSMTPSEAALAKERQNFVPLVTQALQSPAVLQRAAVQAGMAGADAELAQALEVVTTPDADLITLRLTGTTGKPTLRLLTAYAGEAVQALRQFQTDTTGEFRESLAQRIRALDEQLEAANRELVRFQRDQGVIDVGRETASLLQQRSDCDTRLQDAQIQLRTIDLKTDSLSREISRESPALAAARASLDQARLRYTSEHPKVKELNAAIAALVAQAAQQPDPTKVDLASQTTPLTSPLYLQVVELRSQKATLAKQIEEWGLLKKRLEERLVTLYQDELQYANLKSRYESLRQTRDQLVGQQGRSEITASQALGEYRLIERPALQPIAWAPRLQAAARDALKWGAIGLLAALMLVLFTQVPRQHIRSPEELQRLTQLPLTACLGNLKQMRESEQSQWAFQTLTTLLGEAGWQHGGQGLVCGITSSNHGEGRTTWVRLLAEEARRRGFLVMTISAGSPDRPRPEVPGVVRLDPTPTDLAAPKGPFDVAGELYAIGGEQAFEFPLPPQVWDPECRRQWGEAIDRWKGIDNLMVFADLPPASMPETSLLAERFPYLIWLCEHQRADVAATRQQIRALRQFGGRFVGVGYNYSGRHS